MSTAAEPDSVTAKDIIRALMGHLRLTTSSCVILPNVYVANSPWESDVVKISSAYYWTEYEVKVSVSDYRADFCKRRHRWNPDSLQKHDAYRNVGPIEIRSDYGNRVVKTIAKPKQFYFVVPKGLLDRIDVPDHCGIMEFERTDRRSGWGLTTTRLAPVLKGHSPLDSKAIFGMAMKVSHRIAYQ